MPTARYLMPDGKIALFDVPEGTTPQQAQSFISQIDPSKLVAPQQDNNDYLSRVGSDISGSLNKGADILTEGTRNPLSAALQVGGQAANATLAPITEAVKSGYESLPASVTQPINNVAQKATDAVKSAYQSGIDKLANTSAGQAIGDYGMNSPNLQANMQGVSDAAKAAANLISTVPVGKAGQIVGQGVSDAAKGAEGLADQYAVKYPGETPMQDIVPKAAATPEAIEAGAKIRYDNATQMGGVIKPQGVADTVNAIKQKVGYQTPEGITFAGENPVTDTINRLDAVVKSGQPVSLAGLDEMDGRLSSDISQAMRAGDKESASKLLEIKSMLKNASSTVKPEDLANPQAFNEWKSGDALWTAKSKMQQLQNIVDDAYNTDNPDTAIRTGYRNLYKQLRKNPSGWTPDEIDLVNQGAKRGVTAAVLKTVSGRLMSHMTALTLGAAGGAVGGVGGAMAGLAVGEGMGFPMRAAANALQEGRAMAPLNAVGARPAVTAALPQSIKDIMQLPPAQAKAALNALKTKRIAP